MTFGTAIRKMKKWGGAMAVTIPQKYIEDHGIKEGDVVQITFDDFIHIKPLDMKALGVRLEAAKEILERGEK